MRSLQISSSIQHDIISWESCKLWRGTLLHCNLSCVTRIGPSWCPSCRHVECLNQWLTRWNVCHLCQTLHVMSPRHCEREKSQLLAVPNHSQYGQAVEASTWTKEFDPGYRTSTAGDNHKARSVPSTRTTFKIIRLHRNMLGCHPLNSIPLCYSLAIDRFRSSHWDSTLLLQRQKVLQVCLSVVSVIF